MRRLSQQELAEQRTDLARERTSLARHRTFAAWVRTGLAAMAVGVGAAELLGDLQPPWMVPTASALLIACGAVLLVFGLVGYRRSLTTGRAAPHDGLPRWSIPLVTLATIAAALLLLAAVLIG